MQPAKQGVRGGTAERTREMNEKALHSAVQRFWREISLKVLSLASPGRGAEHQNALLILRTLAQRSESTQASVHPPSRLTTEAANRNERAKGEPEVGDGGGIECEGSD